MAAAPVTPRDRLAVASRAVAAIVGGYGVATLGTLLIAYAGFGSRAGALMAGMMASFAIYAGAIIWAFATSSAARAWAGIAVVGTALVIGCLALRMFVA